MYMDDEGNFKGDALVVYFRKESVELAKQMLDDTDFRLGESSPTGKMRVQTADFSFKSQQDAPAKPSNRDKRKIMKRTQKLNKFVSFRIWCLWVEANGWKSVASLRIGTMTYRPSLIRLVGRRL